MAKREVAYTFLDVKYPQLICKGCQSEFEYLESDCTHFNVSFQPPNTGMSKGSKGKSKGSEKGSNGMQKGKGKGADAEYKGKGKGKGEGKSSDIDIMAILQQYGSGIISEEQAIKIKNAMKISPAAPKPKTPLQEAKAEYKEAIAGLNVAKNKLDQSKESILAIDKKFKAMLVTVCENTRDYTNLKQVAEECKAKLDEFSTNQDATIDEKIANIAASQACAMAQISIPDSEEEGEYNFLGEAADPFSDDYEQVYTRQQQNLEGDGNDFEEAIEDADMQQAAVKRHLSPLLPPLDIGAEHSTEEIMGQLHALNVAKKSKLTPRGGIEE